MTIYVLFADLPHLPFIVHIDSRQPQRCFLHHLSIEVFHSEEFQRT